MMPGHAAPASSKSAPDGAGAGVPVLLAQVAAPPQSSNAIVTVQAPAVESYWFSADKSGLSTVLDGYVPDQQLRTRLGAMAGLDVQGLEIAGGAPEGLAAAIDFGLGALGFMSEGRFALRDGVITLKGRAATPSAFATLDALNQAGAPQGFVLAMAEFALPLADPFTFTASKDADGAITLTGFLPSKADKDELAKAVGADGSDQSALADGAPDAFTQTALAGVGALQDIELAVLSFDGSRWSLSGTVPNVDTEDAVRAQLLGAGIDLATWTVDLTLATPETAEAVETPVESPAIEVPSATEPAPAEPPADAPVVETGPEPEVLAQPAEPAPEPPAEPIAATPAVEPEPESAAAEAVVDPDYGFAGSKSETGLVLKGDIPATWVASYLATLADGAQVEALGVAEGAPASFTSFAAVGVQALSRLDAGELAFEQGRWRLAGEASEPAVRDAVLAAIDALPDTMAWDTDITGPSAFELCERNVLAFDERNSVLFNSGNAVIATSSFAALDELAGYLSACDAAMIDVEGHTDADGAEDLNLALSVARAEAVVEALMARGIAASRLYAIGYGEGMPIASNDTQAGKQANRRIVVKVRPAD